MWSVAIYNISSILFARDILVQFIILTCYFCLLLACLGIRGAMSTNPTATLDMLLDLPPLQLVVEHEAVIATYRLRQKGNVISNLEKRISYRNHFFGIFPLRVRHLLYPTFFVSNFLSANLYHPLPILCISPN